MRMILNRQNGERGILGSIGVPLDANTQEPFLLTAIDGERYPRSRSISAGATHGIATNANPVTNPTIHGRLLSSGG